MYIIYVYIRTFARVLILAYAYTVRTYVHAYVHVDAETCRLQALINDYSTYHASYNAQVPLSAFFSLTRRGTNHRKEGCKTDTDPIRSSPAS